MTISVPEDVATKLAERAAGRGETVAAYAAQLVADSVTKPTLDELLAPMRGDFAASGLSEGELNDLLRSELDAHRREKKARPA